MGKSKSGFHDAATAACHYAGRFGSKSPQRWSGDEVSLQIEGVLDGGMDN